jgi:DNA-binding CsgD family transcriptional regulator
MNPPQRRRIAPQQVSRVNDAGPRLAPLLLDLHRCVELEPLWQASNRLLREAMDIFHCLAALPCVEELAPVFIRTTLPVRSIPDYWAKLLQARPPLMDIVQQNPGIKVSVLSDHMGEAELKATRFYKEFIKPEGWRHAAGLLFWDGPRFIGHIGILRTKAQGDFTPAERALLDELHPHLDAAVQRVALLDRERQTGSALQSGFAHAPEGRMILDLDLAPVFANHAAEQTCAYWSLGPDALALKTALLRKQFTLPDDIAKASRELVADYELLVRENRHAGATVVREIRHPSIPGLSARIQILQSRTPTAFKPSLLVELSRVEVQGRQARSVPDFALTQSERRVAALAADGKSNAEIGSHLGLSVHTVRAHLREVFSKIGIQRRAQLGQAFSSRRP